MHERAQRIGFDAGNALIRWNDDRLAALVAVIGRIILALSGAALVVAGVRAKADSDAIFRAMAADPVCAHALTLATPHRRGRTCSIEAGTIVRVYTDHDKKHPTDYIQEESARGTTWEVGLAPQYSPFLANVRPGSRASVEFIRGGAAFISVKGGTAFGLNDPNGSRNFYVIPLALAGVIFFLAVFGMTVKPLWSTVLVKARKART